MTKENPLKILVRNKANQSLYMSGQVEAASFSRQSAHTGDKATAVFTPQDIHLILISVKD